jgi:hypothetical protein
VRQCRQLSYIAELTSEIQHISGKENIVADTLSQPLPPQESAKPAGESDTAATPSTLAAVAATAYVCDSLQPGLDYATIDDTTIVEIYQSSCKSCASGGQPTVI